MARQRPTSRPTARPTAPARAAPTQQQSRPATTYAPAQAAPAPTATAAAPAASQGPGLFGQMASTAAGVAVGSTIGHAIGGLFSGGSSAPAEAAPQQTNAAANNDQYTNNCAGAPRASPSAWTTTMETCRSATGTSSSSRLASRLRPSRLEISGRRMGLRS
ncbi:hypothetical protein CIB48_g88 [Xylaria polymorpha]|nr:hypothetical protein CIB48_g88 [Xylaria polymorpha]